MSYTVETIFTKPADKQWFGQIHPRLARKFARIDKSRAIGLVSRTVEKIDDNSFKVTAVWSSEADYQNFLTKKGASVADAIRQQYAQNNGIAFTTSVV